MWTFAADAASVSGIDPTIAFGALIGGCVSIIASIGGVMWSMAKTATERADTANATALKSKDDALQKCEGETLAAEKDADLWRQKCTKLEIENATLRARLRAKP